MKPRDIFKLAVRILGLVFLYHGLSAVPVLLGGIFFGGGSNPLGVFFMVGWPLLVGIGALKYAAQVTDYFYPQSED